MSNEPKFNDLMQRRALIREEWMKRVDEVKNSTHLPRFYGAGVVIEKNGALRMTAHHARTHEVMWELRVEPFSREVKEERP